MKYIKTFENFINEASASQGPKVKRLMQTLKDVEYETIKDMEGQDEEPSDALYSAMKQVGCSAEECIVIGEYHTTDTVDWNSVLDAAKKAGIEYVEATDDNGSAIVFSSKQ